MDFMGQKIGIDTIIQKVDKVKEKSNPSDSDKANYRFLFFVIFDNQRVANIKYRFLLGVTTKINQRQTAKNSIQIQQIGAVFPQQMTYRQLAFLIALGI